MIVVLTDGNYDSWYIDSPIKKDSKYQTYIGVDVVTYIDKEYKTIPKKKPGRLQVSVWGDGALNNPSPLVPLEV